MRKITFLIMLLLMSSQIFCQNTGIKNISISEPQINEIYKGLKQGEYLKIRLEKTEKTLDNAGELIKEQKSALENSAILINAKDQLILNNEEIWNQEKIIFNNRISSLQADYEILENTSKIKSRKNLWSGIKIGGFTVAVLGLAGFILIK